MHNCEKRYLFFTVVIKDIADPNYLKRRQNLMGKTLRTIYYNDRGYCEVLQPSSIHSNPRNLNWKDHNWFKYNDKNNFDDFIHPGEVTHQTFSTPSQKVLTLHTDYNFLGMAAGEV